MIRSIQKSSAKSANDSVSLKVGGWFEAHATGWGALAIVVIVLLFVMVGQAAGSLPALGPEPVRDST